MSFITIQSHKKRLIGLSVLMSFFLLSIVSRLVKLTVVQSQFLKTQGDARMMRRIVMPAYRGNIEDRNGEPLAVSLPAYAVWMDPNYFNPSKEELKTLALLLNVSSSGLNHKIIHSKYKHFVYLKRGIDPKLGKKIQSLKIPGLFLKTEYKRYYPHASVTAHVLGLTNIDDQGLEGLELAYQNWLEGKQGLKRVLKNRLGHVIANKNILEHAQPGRDLQLSLDQRIQYMAFKELSEGVHRYNARSGSAIVLDIKTGEILSMVNYPSYNPNQRSTQLSRIHRNLAVTDVFEPGSVLKPLSVASLLSSGHCTVNTLVDTSPGQLILRKHIIKDHRNHGLLNLTQILQVSSNVGISKLILGLPSQTLLNSLRGLGFGEVTLSGFPGERCGFLPETDIKNPFILATLSFGYGLSVTALQLIQAYATLANNGIYQPVTFLKQKNNLIQGKRVMDAHVSQTILTMLESVLAQGGTAPLARIKGYRVTGKTGTTRMASQKGYQDRYNSLFVGIAPASQPRLVTLVVLHDLGKKHYYGGYTAAIIFSRIMEYALRTCHIAPDIIEKT